MNGKRFLLPLHLNHYPNKCNEYLKLTNQQTLCLTGHIHGLWRVQKNIINVGVDAFHFQPVSIEEVALIYNAMLNHYDNNVFLK